MTVERLGHGDLDVMAALGGERPHATTTTPRQSDLDVEREQSTCSDSSLTEGGKARGFAAENWTDAQRWSVIFTTSLVCFVVGINSTALLAAVDDVSAEFQVDVLRFDYSFFLVTAWNTGAAVMPLFLLPLMEDFGIRPIYYALYALFFVFVVVQAVAPNFATLIVARVVAGSCGGVLQNCVDGIIADAWGDDIHSRAVSMTGFIFALLGGVTIGPVIGGGIIRSLGWRWILYVQIIIYGAIAPYIVLTLKDPRAGARRSHKSKKEQLLAALDETIFRAVRMLFTEFVVGSFTLLSSFAFGTVFIMTQSIPQVFTALYGWPAWQNAVVQVAIFVGELVGVGLCLFQDKIVYPRFAYRHSQSSKAVPEPRLYTVIPCSIFGLTAGFFIYGWTSYSSIAWVWPALGLLLIGVGIMAIIQAVSTYVTDCYVSNASSAISGVAFGENIFAAFLPLATRDMYNSLGFQWASSLLGFAGLLLSMAPVVLVLYGRKIRAQSKFAD